MVVTKRSLQDTSSDFAYWQTRSYAERLAALEEIRSEYHAWEQSTRKESDDVQPGFQRVYRIIKR